MASIIAVDLGGTNCRLGLFQLEKQLQPPLVQKKYHNAKYGSLDEIIRAFIDDFSIDAQIACLGVAGVVEAGTASLTNLDWHIGAEALCHTFSFSEVHVINDMTALAEAIPLLTAEDSRVIQQGEIQRSQAIAVMAPGTGLGQGYVLPAGDDFIARGSEGGHSGFAPGNEDELKLLRWFMENYGEVFNEVEEIGSGPAIGLLYSYCREQEKIEPAGWVVEKMTKVKDINPVIVEGATAAPSCPLCRRTMELYLGLLGGEAANLALKLYARGGLYIGGGLMAHLVESISMEPFLQGFRKSGKMEALLQAIPIFIIRKKDVQLWGAARYGYRQYVLRQ